MQVPLIVSNKTSEGPEYRRGVPKNMVPVPTETGISAGYFKPTEGILTFGTGPGVDRGGINWNGQHFRVMGGSLVRVESTGAVTVLGDIAGDDWVSFDYSFDNLIIAGGGNLYYWNGTLKQVTDPDIGTVLDALWVDGYTMTTDGTDLIVTELGDPYSVNPLKYGSSEVNPDNIVGLIKLRDEPYAVNRYTMEQFNNIGGDLFPFQRNEGGQLTRGALSKSCFCIFSEQIAFLGSGLNEPLAIWVGQNGATAKISTREVDTVLLGFTEAQLTSTVLEKRTFKSHEFLYVHLPDQTMVYDANASAVLQTPVWHMLTSSVVDLGQYRARGMVWCYDKWLCGDPTSPKIGELVEDISTHHGDVIGWEFGTTIFYNAGMGAIFNMLELVALPGRVPLGADPVVWTSYSEDGETWSQERTCSAGRQGERAKRLTWLRQGRMSNIRLQRFRGTSDAHLAFARLEVQLEPLSA